MISGRDERTWIASVEHHASRLGRMRGSTHRRYTHTAPRTGGNRRTAQIVRRNIPASYEISGRVEQGHEAREQRSRSNRSEDALEQFRHAHDFATRGIHDANLERVK